MTLEFGDGYDWRGIKIQPGDTVIYGAGVGRSIALVEAEVLKVNGSKVKLKVRHRAYGGSYRTEVTVGCDRVTVVAQLPPSQLGETVEQEVAKRDAAVKRRKDNQASHDLLPEPAWNNDVKQHRAEYLIWVQKPCTRCNVVGWQGIWGKACTG